MSVAAGNLEGTYGRNSLLGSDVKHLLDSSDKTKFYADDTISPIEIDQDISAIKVGVKKELSMNILDKIFQHENSTMAPPPAA